MSGSYVVYYRVHHGDYFYNQYKLATSENIHNVVKELLDSSSYTNNASTNAINTVVNKLNTIGRAEFGWCSMMLLRVEDFISIEELNNLYNEKTKQEIEQFFNSLAGSTTSK